jgi:hypothetical protein
MLKKFVGNTWQTNTEATKMYKEPELSAEKSREHSYVVILWMVTPFTIVAKYRRFGGKYRRHLQS